MNQTHLGWMVVATTPKGTKGLPADPDVIDHLDKVGLAKGLPTFGGVWTDETDAQKALDKVPEEMRGMFKVAPVAFTFLVKGA